LVAVGRALTHSHWIIHPTSVPPQILGDEIRGLYAGYQLPRNVAALKQTQLFLLGCQSDLLLSDPDSRNRIEVWQGTFLVLSIGSLNWLAHDLTLHQ